MPTLLRAYIVPTLLHAYIVPTLLRTYIVPTLDRANITWANTPTLLGANTGFEAKLEIATKVLLPVYSTQTLLSVGHRAVPILFHRAVPILFHRAVPILFRRIVTIQ